VQAGTQTTAGCVGQEPGGERCGRRPAVSGQVSDEKTNACEPLLTHRKNRTMALAPAAAVVAVDALALAAAVVAVDVGKTTAAVLVTDGQWHRQGTTVQHPYTRIDRDYDTLIESDAFPRSTPWP